MYIEKFNLSPLQQCFHLVFNSPFSSERPQMIHFLTILQSLFEWHAPDDSPSYYMTAPFLVTGPTWFTLLLHVYDSPFSYGIPQMIHLFTILQSLLQWQAPDDSLSYYITVPFHMAYPRWFTFLLYHSPFSYGIPQMIHPLTISVPFHMASPRWFTLLLYHSPFSYGIPQMIHLLTKLQSHSQWQTRWQNFLLYYSPFPMTSGYKHVHSSTMYWWNFFVHCNPMIYLICSGIAKL